MAGCCENGHDPSDSINYGEFLGQLRKCGFLKEYYIYCIESINYLLGLSKLTGADV